MPRALLASALLALLLASPAATTLFSADSPAPASQPASKSTTLSQLIADLRSPQYSLRNEATYSLLQLPAVQRSDIENALAKESDPEAAARLQRIALHLYLKATNSFHGNSSLLGISLNLEFATNPQNKTESIPAVAVLDTQPGFPAAELLRPGDRIIALDNRPLPKDLTIDDFRQFVNASRPGTPLAFTVLREEKQLELRVPTVGIPNAIEGLNAITTYVQERNDLADRYAAALQSPALPPARLVIKDDTPATDNPRFEIQILDP